MERVILVLNTSFRLLPDPDRRASRTTPPTTVVALCPPTTARSGYTAAPRVGLGTGLRVGGGRLDTSSFPFYHTCGFYGRLVCDAARTSPRTE